MNLIIARGEIGIRAVCTVNSVNYMARAAIISRSTLLQHFW